MMDKSLVVLSQDADLKGKDLSLSYRHYKASKELPDNPAQFKKKEPLEAMAKSILKHRILTLTGKSVTSIEDEIGYVSPDGTGLTVDMLRRLAHFLILQACGHLEQLPETSPKRKRPLETDNSVHNTPENQPTKRARVNGASPNVSLSSQSPRSLKSTRRSLAPEVLRKQASKAAAISERNGDTTVFTSEERPSPRKNMSVQTQVLKREETKDLNLGPNPTQQMIERNKRRSLAITSSNVTDVSLTQLKETASPKPASKKSAAHINSALKEENPTPETKISLQKQPNIREPVNRLIGYPGSNRNEIFIAEFQPPYLKYEAIRNQIKTFTGANLSVLHTPCDWGALEVFNMVQSIRQLNRKASISTFSVLVGCGLDKLHLFHEALNRQTKHVQLVVFEREDKNLEQPPELLREVNAYFLIGYFFPGCEEEEKSKVTVPKMVRPGFTTCFHTKSSEDLENNIVHALSEEGDWIMDLCCRGRELSLAAQKMGRNAIALNDNQSSLTSLQEKASNIAKYHDKSFQVGMDGAILKFD